MLKNSSLSANKMPLLGKKIPEEYFFLCKDSLVYRFLSTFLHPYFFMISILSLAVIGRLLK